MIVLLPSARADSGVASWLIQFASVGSKSTQGIPKPATVKVSMGLRRLVENAQ